jgi:hypothetical protein
MGTTPAYRRGDTGVTPALLAGGSVIAGALTAQCTGQPLIQTTCSTEESLSPPGEQRDRKEDWLRKNTDRLAHEIC